MTQQEIAVYQARRILDGKENSHDKLSQIQGLIQLANWLDIYSDELDEILSTALDLRYPTRSKS